MSSIRSIGRAGCALLAVLLLGAVGAASASAAEFEAEPGFPVGFTATGGVGLLETARGRSVTCESSSGSGEVEGATSVGGVHVQFHGCYAEHFPLLTCTSTGVAGVEAGEIITETIKASPVDLDAAHTEAGLLLEPASGETFARFNCAFSPINETLTVTGSVIGKAPTAQLNEFRETLNLEFKALLGAQEYTQVEGAGPAHVLMTSGTGTEPFAAEESAIDEAVAGETTTEALEGKRIRLVP